MSNSNPMIKGNEELDILLNGSTGLIIQNLSDSEIGFKLKGSGEDVSGGLLLPKKAMKFESDIVVWTLNKSNALLYVLRS